MTVKLAKWTIHNIYTHSHPHGITPVVYEHSPNRQPLELWPKIRITLGSVSWQNIQCISKFATIETRQSTIFMAWMSFLGRQIAHRTYSSISSHDIQSLHPLAFQLFSNSASENRWIAHVRARCRNAISSSGGSERAWFKASANSSVDWAWYPAQNQSKYNSDWKALLPVGCPLNGTMISLRGPPDACATGIIPATYQLSSTMKCKAIGGNSPWTQQYWYRSAHQP